MTKINAIELPSGKPIGVYCFFCREELVNVEDTKTVSWGVEQVVCCLSCGKRAVDSDD